MTNDDYLMNDFFDHGAVKVSICPKNFSEPSKTNLFEIIVFIRFNVILEMASSIRSVHSFESLIFCILTGKSLLLAREKKNEQINIYTSVINTRNTKMPNWQSL